MSGEFELIRRVAAASRAAGPPPAVLTGIGDDAAVLAPPPGRLVVCCDLVAEGVHFTADTPPELVGRKAVAVNLSDAAACAAVPFAALCGLLTPRDRGLDFAAGVMAGVQRLCRESGVSLVGGDTATHDGPTVVTVTLLATAEAPVTRSGARAGDVLLLTGAVGGSLREGRHLTFSPRVAEARAAAGAAGPGGVHAMIDLSDGLLADCGRLCGASGVGAVVDAAAVPVHPDADVAAGDDPLTDGEDFELLLAVTEEDAATLLAAPPACGLTKIGRVVAGSGVRVENAPPWHGRPGRPAGYEHGYA